MFMALCFVLGSRFLPKRSCRLGHVSILVCSRHNIPCSWPLTSCHSEFRSTDIVYFSLKTFDSWICLFPISKIPNLLQAHEPFETIHKLRVNEEAATPGFQIQVPDGLCISFHKMFLFLCFSLYLYNITGAAFSGQINRAANRTDSFRYVYNW